MNVQYSSKQLHVEHKIIVHIAGTYISDTHLKAVNDSGRQWVLVNEFTKAVYASATTG